MGGKDGDGDVTGSPRAEESGTEARTGMAQGSLRSPILYVSHKRDSAAEERGEVVGEPSFFLYIFCIIIHLPEPRLICKSYNRANYQVNMAILYGGVA